MFVKDLIVAAQNAIDKNRIAPEAEVLLARRGGSGINRLDVLGPAVVEPFGGAFVLEDLVDEISTPSLPLAAPDFNSRVTCSKCLGGDVGAKYCRGHMTFDMDCPALDGSGGGWLSPGEIAYATQHEHMHRTCARCGFSWVEKAASPEQLATTSPGEVDPIVVALASSCPVSFSEWVECIAGPGFFCHVCYATTSEKTEPDFNAKDIWTGARHTIGCAWRRARLRFGCKWGRLVEEVTS